VGKTICLKNHYNDNLLWEGVWFWAYVWVSLCYDRDARTQPTFRDDYRLLSWHLRYKLQVIQTVGALLPAHYWWASFVINIKYWTDLLPKLGSTLILFFCPRCSPPLHNTNKFLFFLFLVTMATVSAHVIGCLEKSSSDDTGVFMRSLNCVLFAATQKGRTLRKNMPVAALFLKPATHTLHTHWEQQQKGARAQKNSIT